MEEDLKKYILAGGVRKKAQLSSVHHPLIHDSDKYYRKLVEEKNFTGLLVELVETFFSSW